MRSQRELDAEFTLDTVRDLDALLTRRAAAAATACAQFPIIRALPYGLWRWRDFPLVFTAVRRWAGPGGNLHPRRLLDFDGG